MKRLALLGFCMALGTGCAGNLDNPEAFSGFEGFGGTGGTGGTGGSGFVGPTIEEVMEESCGNVGCHSAQAPAGGLDLVSPNLEGRLVDVVSTNPSCSDQLLVIPGDPDESYLLKKVNDTPDICGLAMPPGISLSVDDTAAIERWILDLDDTSASVFD